MMGTMSEQQTGKRIPGDDHVAVQLRLAVHGGDVEAIRRLLQDDPALASARPVGKDDSSTTPLHLVTAWPACFPGGPQTVRRVVCRAPPPTARRRTAGASAGPGR